MLCKYTKIIEYGYIYELNQLPPHYQEEGNTCCKNERTYSNTAKYSGYGYSSVTCGYVLK